MVAYAGIDSPPDESGDFSSTHRHITKKGSKVFRDTGYEIMMALRSQKRT
ncbi:transposase [Dialister hominis]